MKKPVLVLWTLLGVTSGLFAADPVTPATPSADDSATLRLIGQLIATQPFAKFNLTKEEKAAMVKGFAEGLDTPLDETDIRLKMDEVQAYMSGKMMALRAQEQEAQMAAMATLNFPMDREIQNSTGGKVTLATLVKGKKAVLLDFWASWCGPCMQLMPTLIEKDALLSKQNVVVAGMNTEGDLEKAESVRAKLKISFNWLVEPEGGPFSSLLGIDSIPRMILVSPEGKILYNGHPSDPALYEALGKLGILVEHPPAPSAP
ncbi:MAG: TlpA family protein disulfide reductase [Planctomycetes bacterium]|nr:TlpA family protein disulfide reductase [Planctomycetota bacterium]